MLVYQRNKTYVFIFLYFVHLPIKTHDSRYNKCLFFSRNIYIHMYFIIKKKPTEETHKIFFKGLTTRGLSASCNFFLKLLFALRLHRFHEVQYFIHFMLSPPLSSKINIIIYLMVVALSPGRTTDRSTLATHPWKLLSSAF